MIKRIVNRIALWYLYRMCRSFVIGDYLNEKALRDVISGGYRRKVTPPTIGEIIDIYSFLDNLRKTLEGVYSGKSLPLRVSLPSDCKKCKARKLFQEDKGCTLSPIYRESELCKSLLFDFYVKECPGYYVRNERNLL